MIFNSNFSQDIPHQTLYSHKNIRKNHASNFFFFPILIPSLSYLSLSIEIFFPSIVNWVINLIIFQISSWTPRASPINSAIRTTLSLSLPFLAKNKEKRKGKLQYPPSRYCRITVNPKLEPKWKSHPSDFTWNCHEFFHY